MEKVGILNFYFDGTDENWNQQVHVFTIKRYSGKPEESEEMKPQWFEIDKIPYEKMWVDDKYWLPYVIKGKKVIGTFVFGKEKELIGYSVDVLKSLERK